MPPLVSAIIVTFNNREIIAESIQSLLNQTYKNLEIIVVDNNSTDGTCQFVKNNFPIVESVNLDTNHGFSGGNNIGLKHAKGEYIALLNSDAHAQPEWIDMMVREMSSHGNVGICASKIIYDSSAMIDSAGDGFATNLKGFKRGEGRSLNLYTEEEYVFGACAGAALYRRKMIEEIGFLDEDFFLIHEDTDLNFSAQLAGWMVLYVPTAIAYHKVRSSIGDMSDTAVYYTLRNSEFVRIKNVPAVIFLRCLPAYILTTVAEFLYFALKHRRPGLYLKAKIDVLRKMKVMLDKRRTIMRLKKVSNEYLYSVMTPLRSRELLRSKAERFFRR